MNNNGQNREQDRHDQNMNLLRFSYSTSDTSTHLNQLFNNNNQQEPNMHQQNIFSSFTEGQKNLLVNKNKGFYGLDDSFVAEIPI
ncbi:10874_t:CDS:1, partial [Ambispora gerdemannii]